jgi:hypothetical protein
MMIGLINVRKMIFSFSTSGRRPRTRSFLASDEQTQQMIKANEMIDMRVRDEDSVDASYLPSRK